MSSTTRTLVRTQDEIVKRVANLAGKDAFGWSRELLITFLDFEHARPFLVESATEDQWGSPSSDPRHELIEYLEFAWEKAHDARGISAGRSVDKIEQWLWLAGEDEVLARFMAASYSPYGIPRLRVVTEALAPERLAELDGA